MAAPKTPILTKALGGDQQVTLRWTSNREPDLIDYQVYRTDREEAAQDVRTMTLVHTEPVPAGDPLERPAEVAWIDSPAPGRITLYYRLVAVNDLGNASEPSQLVVTRAFDDTRPAPPTWGAPATGPGSTVRLEWTSPNAGLRCLVQRRIMGATGWENTSSWLKRGDYRYEDRSRLAGLQYVYRLRVLDTAGRTNGTYHELTV